MKTSSLNEIRKELLEMDPRNLREICLRLGRFKKENKEMLHYLLFEAQDEHSYVEGTKEEVAVLFKDLPESNVYFMKKSLRKILRLVNRQIKYSGVASTELELRIFFCMKMREARVPMKEGTVLYNLYQQQLKKTTSVLNKLPEDLQADYQLEVRDIS